jgi:hypothetical protein
MARRRTQEAKAGYRAAYGRLVEVARASIKQAGQVQSMLQEAPGSRRRLPEELSRFAQLLGQVISQSRRRVLEGEEVPATERSCSPSSSPTQP